MSLIADIIGVIDIFVRWIKKISKWGNEWVQQDYYKRYSEGMKVLGSNRKAIGEALIRYYASSNSDTTQLSYIRYVYPNGDSLDLPLVTRKEYIREKAPQLDFNFQFTGEIDHFEISQTEISKAKEKWQAAKLDFRDDPIFSLQSIHSVNMRLELEFRKINFFTHRASYGEVFDELGLAVADSGLVRVLSQLRQGDTRQFPLRTKYMRGLGQLLALQKRICAGGPIAVIAARTGDADLAFIIRRRSEKVSDEPLALTPVPRAFHSLEVNDPALECDLSICIYREMWEELFGGKDKPDGELSALHFLDKSPAIKELYDGKGENHILVPLGLMWDLYRGNFIASYCLYITDPTWWSRYSNSMKLNWEFDTIRNMTPVFANRGGLMSLFDAREWAVDSYFAFIEALRWLSFRDETVSKFRNEIPNLVLTPF